MGNEFYKGHVYHADGLRCILNDIERERKIYSPKLEF